MGTLLGLVETAQPRRHFAIGCHVDVAAADRRERLTRDARLEGAQRHRQYAAFVRFEDAEGPRELDQRRRVGGRDLEREARRVDQRPSGFVDEVGGGVSLNNVCSANGPVNATSLTVWTWLPLTGFSASAVPSGAINRICCASVSGTWPVKLTRNGVIGEHAAAGLSRLHSRRARNAGRTLKSRRLAAP